VAVRATFGEAALVQRCQVHKMRNILEYLNDRLRPWAQAILRHAYQSADVKTAQRLLLREGDHVRVVQSRRISALSFACHRSFAGL
jgi:transposase-like protein